MAKTDKSRGNPKPVAKSTTTPTIKSSNAKRKSPPAAKRPLSNEFVQDSDDEMKEPSVTPVKAKALSAKRKTPEKITKTKAAAVEVSSDSESSSEESDEGSSEASKSYEKTTKVVSKSKSSSGCDTGEKEEEDSSDDEESDSSSTTTPPPSK